jgi:hypothetical protein
MQLLHKLLESQTMDLHDRSTGTMQKAELLQAACHVPKQCVLVKQLVHTCMVGAGNATSKMIMTMCSLSLAFKAWLANG